MFKKKYRIRIYDGRNCVWRDPALPSTYRFRWTAERAWRDAERMRIALGFDRWWHMIVDMDHDL